MKSQQEWNTTERKLSCAVAWRGSTCRYTQGQYKWVIWCYKWGTYLWCHYTNIKKFAKTQSMAKQEWTNSNWLLCYFSLEWTNEREERMHCIVHAKTTVARGLHKTRLNIQCTLFLCTTSSVSNFLRRNKSFNVFCLLIAHPSAHRSSFSCSTDTLQEPFVQDSCSMP